MAIVVVSSVFDAIIDVFVIVMIFFYLMHFDLGLIHGVCFFFVVAVVFSLCWLRLLWHTRELTHPCC